MAEVKIAIVGVGNCASSLVQGIHYYSDGNPDEVCGLMHWDIGGYTPGDVKVVAAFDIDERKVGHDVGEAIFAEPNCTAVFHRDVPHLGVDVSMSPIMDGFAEHMLNYPENRRFKPIENEEPSKADIINTLVQSKADVLLNYLPVGSERASRFYADCALEAGVAFINNMPTFIASDPQWANRFEERGLPIIGDDIKSQFGATISHRVLSDLLKKRGVKLDRTYQLNFGGNTDFLNMLDHDRIKTKKRSKTEAVQSAVAKRLENEDMHIGPSDYVAWQKDNKVAFIRLEGRLFGDVPMNMEIRLSVEDSPNSAGVVIDSIRCCKLALDRGEAGILSAPSAYFCKHPPEQMTDDEAFAQTEQFIAGRDGNDH